MNSTIATFMAIDTVPEDAVSEYSMLGGQSSAAARRGIYWKMVITWGATARRCYPDARVVVVTNDPDDMDLGKVSLHETLAAIGVERLFVPFERFKPPPGRSKRSINNFYRLDAASALVNRPGPADASFFITDSDVVWVRRAADLDSYLPVDGFAFAALSPMYGPHVHHPHNLSRAQLGDTFRRIDPAYPEPYPMWYAVNFIGGRRALLQQFMRECERAWSQFLQATAVQPLYLANGNNVMENEELVGSFVLNRKLFSVTPPDGFYMRLFTLEYSQGPTPVDTRGVVWHVPQEKQRGLPLLYDRVMDRQSEFWTISLSEMPDYLGAYLGVPKRKFDISYTLRQQLERYGRMVGRAARRWNARRKLARELKQ